ncbi:hypothetical protein MLD38_037744 [Melastoma candidum]|uniref:Uncharacterized protein n=1 Tax=Melastoma candidum TaxID=119954 RepID=A0ACB9LNL5_9MYRT|nr:hypothetical protein MLD38_037744 [Melastoma candidum]
MMGRTITSKFWGFHYIVIVIITCFLIFKLFRTFAKKRLPSARPFAGLRWEGSPDLWNFCHIIARQFPGIGSPSFAVGGFIDGSPCGQCRLN